MKKNILTSLFLCILCISWAQNPEDQLRSFGDRLPIEKVYLHFDRENYIAGETAWFKAYLASDYLPDTISTVLYVELLRDSSTVISKKVLPVLFGATNGQLEIPDSIRSGTYLVRAWTPNQLNHNPDFIYKKQVQVFGRRREDLYENPRQETRLEFFPESGNFVAGVQNTIAVKITNERGLPIDFKGKLFDEKNSLVTEFATLHDGLGMFDLVPSQQNYYLVNANEVDGKKYPLPRAMSSGVVLSTIPHPQGHFFELRQNVEDPSLRAAYIIGQMQHHLVFRKDIKNDKDLSGLINTTRLRSGILHITVFNAAGIPLAERLAFINNREYVQNAELLPDSIDTKAKSRNKFHIQLRDTIQGHISISVVDPDFELFPEREENIYSTFLLSSDLRGYIHNPSWYFRNDDELTKTALDLVMMTNGWRRFTWTAIPDRAATVPDPGFIRLSGKATLRDAKKPFDNKSLLFYIVGSDSARNMMMARTDGNGRFLLDSLMFFGPARILISDARGKKGLFVDVHPDPDSLHRSFDLPNSGSIPLNRFDLIAKATQMKIAEDYDLIRNSSGTMMQGVTVKARTRSPLQELEERYASGMFSGMSERTYDLTNNNNETVAYANIFDFLQMRVPGLEVGSDGPDYVVYYRQGPSVSSMGEIPMTLFLNEIVTDANTIATIPANEVALVKVYSSFAGATGNGAGGAMAIYTKKGEDRFDISSGRADNIHYNGFSVIKEFYSPDYNGQPAERAKADHRITLQWKPDIMVSGVNPKIPVVFFNNDRTKKFKVIVEGMTYDGKLLMLEKIIQ
jgi:hypothetical protein